MLHAVLCGLGPLLSACRGPLTSSSSTRLPRPWSPPPSFPWCWAANRSGTAQLLSVSEMYASRTEEASE